MLTAVKCPSCGNEANTLLKELKNECFSIEAYECGRCHIKFKVTS